MLSQSERIDVAASVKAPRYGCSFRFGFHFVWPLDRTGLELLVGCRTQAAVRHRRPALDPWTATLQVQSPHGGHSSNADNPAQCMYCAWLWVICLKESKPTYCLGCLSERCQANFAGVHHASWLHHKPRFSCCSSSGVGKSCKMLATPATAVYSDDGTLTKKARVQPVQTLPCGDGRRSCGHQFRNLRSTSDSKGWPLTSSIRVALTTSFGILASVWKASVENEKDRWASPKF